PGYALPCRRSQLTASRAGGPSGDVFNLKRSVRHVLRTNEGHDDDSSLPLASGEYVFIKRSLYKLIPFPRSMSRISISGACSAILSSRINPGEYFAASASYDGSQ